MRVACPQRAERRSWEPGQMPRQSKRRHATPQRERWPADRSPRALDRSPPESRGRRVWTFAPRGRPGGYARLRRPAGGPGLDSPTLAPRPYPEERRGGPPARSSRPRGPCQARGRYRSSQGPPGSPSPPREFARAPATLWRFSGRRGRGCRRSQPPPADGPRGTGRPPSGGGPSGRSGDP